MIPSHRHTSGNLILLKETLVLTKKKGKKRREARMGKAAIVKRQGILIRWRLKRRPRVR